MELAYIAPRAAPESGVCCGAYDTWVGVSPGRRLRVKGQADSYTQSRPAIHIANRLLQQLMKEMDPIAKSKPVSLGVRWLATQC
jgi:hypothetical protein